MPIDIIMGESMIISLAEITRWRYDNDRREKDKLTAQTKFGYVLKLGDAQFAYIKDGDKCYRGAVTPWHDVNDFQNGELSGVQTTINAVINPRVKADAKASA